MNPGSTCFRLAFSMTGLDTGVWLHILCNVILPPFFFFYMKQFLNSKIELFNSKLDFFHSIHCLVSLLYDIIAPHCSNFRECLDNGWPNLDPP